MASHVPMGPTRDTDTARVIKVGVDVLRAAVDAGVLVANNGFDG